MHLKLTGAEGADASAADDDALSGLAGGCCFDFSRLNDHLFLVGTEEGRIHKCSRAYQSQYLETYNGTRLGPTARLMRTAQTRTTP